MFRANCATGCCTIVQQVVGQIAGARHRVLAAPSACRSMPPANVRFDRAVLHRLRSSCNVVGTRPSFPTSPRERWKPRLGGRCQWRERVILWGIMTDLIIMKSVIISYKVLAKRSDEDSLRRSCCRITGRPQRGYACGSVVGSRCDRCVFARASLADGFVRAAACTLGFLGPFRPAEARLVAAVVAAFSRAVSLVTVCSAFLRWRSVRSTRWITTFNSRCCGRSRCVASWR